MAKRSSKLRFPFSQKPSILAASVAALFAATVSVHAQVTWTGGSTVNSNWSQQDTPPIFTNWTSAPTSGSALIFAGNTRLNPNNDFVGFTANSITFALTTSAFTLSGNALTVNAGINNNSTNIQKLTFGGTGITLGGSQTWSATTGALWVTSNVALAGSTLTIAGKAGNFGGLPSADTSTQIDGNISGAGGLTIDTTATAAGSGVVVLTGNNNYTGATLVQSGVLVAASNGALSGSGVTVSNGASLVIKGGVITTGVPLSITGTGVSGLGALAGGAYTVANSQYAGAITLAGDALITTGAGTEFTLTGGIDTQGHTLTLGTTTGSATDVFHITTAGISGSGNVVIDTQSATFDVANTYTGSTTIINGATLSATLAGALPSPAADGGSGTVRSAVLMDQTGSGGSTLSLGANQAIASLAGASTSTVNLNGNTLTIGVANAATSTEFDGVVSGSGGLTKDGTSTLILGGANIYTGATNVNGGTLTVNGSLVAASTVNVGTAGTLAGTGTISGNATLTGNGVINLGAGATIGGTLDITGGNWNGLGTVTGQVTASGAANTFTIGSGANLTATTGLNLTGGQIAGTGTLTGSLNDTSAQSSTFGGVIADGTGVSTLTVNNPLTTLTLTGTSTFTGATTLTAGTLQIGNDTSGNLTGSSGVAVADNATLVLDLGTGTTFAPPISLNGANAVLNAIQSGTTTISNPIVGSGGVNQNGTGNTILSATELYTGTTNVNAGTLTVNGSLAAASTVNIASTGTLAGTGTINGNATLTGNGVINLGSTGTIGGTLDVTGGNWNGLGTVNGQVTASGAANTFTIGSGASLTATTGLNLTGGQIAGTGTLAGSLNDTSAQSSTFGGVIADGVTPSSVTVNNAATKLTLTGANTYTGPTTITAGTLSLPTGGSTAAGSAVSVATGGTLNLTGGIVNGNVTLTGNAKETGTSGTIGGTLGVAGGNWNGIGTVLGAVTTNGGTFTVNGSLTAPAGVTVASGQIAGNGTITGSLNYLSGSSSIFGGTIAGTNSTLTVNGSLGTMLVLTGNNTFTGNTTVNGGTLEVDGSIASKETTINSGGTLLGTGTIGGNLTNNGIVQPGGTLGTLNVRGNYTQSAGGNLVVQIASPFSYSNLAVVGTASLAGTLTAKSVGGFVPGPGQTYHFVTAGGGISGTFSNFDNQTGTPSSGLLAGTLTYESNQIVLQFDQQSFDQTFLQGLTDNQSAVANELNKLLNDPRMVKIFAYLDRLPLSQIPAALDRISASDFSSHSFVANSLSSIHTTSLQLRTGNVRAGGGGFSAMGFHIAGNGPDYSGNFGLAGPNGNDGKESKEVAPPPPDERLGVFVTGMGEWANVGNTENARGYDLASGGFTLGVDYKVTPNFILGLDVGYDRTGVNLSNGGNLTVNGGKLGAYGTVFVGGFYVDAAVTGGLNGYDSRRAALGGDARGSTNGGEIDTLFGLGYDIKRAGFTFGPTANFQSSHVGVGNFTEHGSLAPLNVGAQTEDSLRTAVGMKLSYDWKVGGVLVKPEIRAAWQHEFGNTTYSVPSSFANGAGGTFTVTGPEIGRDSALLGAGFTVLWNNRLSTYVYYDGELGRKNYQSTSVSGGVRVAF